MQLVLSKSRMLLDVFTYYSGQQVRVSVGHIVTCDKNFVRAQF